MTWEETIIHVRQIPEYKDLITQSYLEEELTLNAERFYKSEEYQATKRLLRPVLSTTDSFQRLLDIGAGNGISSVAFARDGWQVVALEPDPSHSVGANAIRWLAQHYHLPLLTVNEAYAEALPFPANSFDVVYARQAMHHAQDLDGFASEAYRVLKPGGVLLTVRDHVADTEQEKQTFLQSHALQAFYGGENAFCKTQYEAAIRKAGFQLHTVLAHYDSVINYYPLKTLEKQAMEGEQYWEQALKRKIGILGRIPLLVRLYRWLSEKRNGRLLDEQRIPGKLYTFMAIKNA
jgi:ubiquinone/menaquinone biosynthesis C-methylase UbiE